MIKRLILLIALMSIVKTNCWAQCAIELGGNVYVDNDAITDGLVDGSPLDPSDPPLYVNFITTFVPVGSSPWVWESIPVDMLASNYYRFSLPYCYGGFLQLTIHVCCPL